MSTRHKGSTPRRGELPEPPAGSAGALPAGAYTGAAAAERPLSPGERAALDDAFRRTLSVGVHGLCFSPYLEGQQPGSQVSEAQIRERLAILRPYARWVRSFSCTDGHEQTPRIAHELGLKTLVGAWLDDDREKNEREIEALLALARAGHADLVAVGNDCDFPGSTRTGYMKPHRNATGISR